MRTYLPALLVAALAACSSSEENQAVATADPSPSASPGGDAELVTPDVATVGLHAPDFTLTDLDGNSFTLSEHRGAPVVLEWFNPGCPFVVRAHEDGVLASYPAEALEEGVVWVAINTGAPGKQGHGADVNREAAGRWNMAYPILLDETGAVGRAYAAKTTPHLFVIDAEGVLVYAGAADDDPRGKLGDGRTNYVEACLNELPGAVSTSETKPYGCSVKYAD
jgi:peroxiredoxin